MGAYKFIQESIQNVYKNRTDSIKQKIITWRLEPVVYRIERPTNLARARILGYKAKQGFVLVRTRIQKGRRKRRSPMGGRKPRHAYLYVQPQLSHQAIAEQRVNHIYKNLEVLNSYWVGEDGEYKFFEIILADPTKIKLNAFNNRGRAFRGLTSSGRKSRGIGRGRLGRRTQREKD